MSFFKKIKDILYEEEVTGVDIPKEEEKKEVEVERQTPEFSDKTFELPVFDESDYKEEIETPFEEQITFKREKKEIFKDHTKFEKVEFSEKKKFKPSLLISPVYGVLNKDYNPEDIVNKDEIEKLDVDAVRKKAFEPKTEEKSVEVVLPRAKKKEISKTIDELLDQAEEEKKESPKHEEKIKIEEAKEEDFDNPDTLENDLFDLIDSMYEKKDGE